MLFHFSFSLFFLSLWCASTLFIHPFLLSLNSRKWFCLPSFFFFLFPLCFAPLGRRWQELVFHKLFSGFHIMSGHWKNMLHLTLMYTVQCFMSNCFRGSNRGLFPLLIYLLLFFQLVFLVCEMSQNSPSQPPRAWRNIIKCLVFCSKHSKYSAHNETWQRKAPNLLSKQRIFGIFAPFLLEKWMKRLLK